MTLWWSQRYILSFVFNLFNVYCLFVDYIYCKVQKRKGKSLQYYKLLLKNMILFIQNNVKKKKRNLYTNYQTQYLHQI